MRVLWAVVMIAAVGAGTGTLAAARSGEQTAAGAPPSIVGVWTLDKDTSDTVERGEGGRAAMPPPGMGSRPGGMGGGGRGGMGGGMPGGMPGDTGGRRDPEQMNRARRLLDELLAPAAGLTIVADGPQVILTTADGRTLRLTADGKEQMRLTGDGEIKSKTRWDGDRLIVEEKIQDGPNVMRTLTASSDGRWLLVTVRVDGGGPGRVLAHHVYERGRGGS